MTTEKRSQGVRDWRRIAEIASQIAETRVSPEIARAVEETRRREYYERKEGK